MEKQEEKAETNEQKEVKGKETTIDLISYHNGKYFHADREVYPYFHLGVRAYSLGVKSPPGQLPNTLEVIKHHIGPLLANLSKQYPRLARQTNGLIIIEDRALAQKEAVREGEDNITVAEAREVMVVPCRYIVSSGKKRMALEDPEMFGDIF